MDVCWGRERLGQKSGHDCDQGSSAEGAVAVSVKFHLVHLEHPLGRLDRALGLLRVRELRRRCRPEDDRTVRARVPRGGFRRQRVRYRMRRPRLFRADAAADTYDDKRELRPRRKGK